MTTDSCSPRPRAVSVKVAVLFAVQCALAGGVATAADAPATASADNQSQAAGAAKDSNGLAEVVVTAQFVRQDIQTTPISMSALTGAMLEQRGVTNIMDVANSTPNILMREGSSGEGMSNTAYIRGIGQSDFLFAYSPRV